MVAQPDYDQAFGEHVIGRPCKQGRRGREPQRPQFSAPRVAKSPYLAWQVQNHGRGSARRIRRCHHHPENRHYHGARQPDKEHSGEGNADVKMIIHQ